ncbi:helix-turn-helix domain-containing protein [Faucicola mancuniensis]|uniref:helix-turn-helix domain-containing protein n=1 Tax=Faucicola mancuniensis TaxID=1309795 RepID=UPI0039773F47
MSNPTTNPKNAPTVDTSHPLGQRLKQAREKKNLSLEDVASQTNILKRHLVALEEGDYESLPQPTFARGFAVNYGRFLGIDSQVINQSFDAQYPANLRQKYEDFKQNAPLQPMGTLQRDSYGGLKINWFVVIGAIVALVVAILVYRTIKNAHHENQPQQTIQEVTPQEQTTGASLSNTGSAINMQAPASTPIATANSASTPMSTGIATAGSSTLDIWIQANATINITDATGKVIMQGDYTRGGHQLTGQAPFNVQIDKVNNVSIDFNKQPMNIKQYAQNNQANFTLQ